MPALLTPSTDKLTTGEHQCIAFETALGWMALEFDAHALHRLVFGYPSMAAIVRSAKLKQLEWADEPPRWVSDLRDCLILFAEGKPQQFGDVPIATDHLTPFARRVVRECRKLGWGRVRTYAEMAKLAGRPGAARAVGNVMASNRFPIVVPCHRVVGSGGGLGGYSAPGGLTTKRRLLEAEGGL